MKIQEKGFLFYYAVSLGIALLTPQFSIAQKLAGMTFSGGSGGGGTIYRIGTDGKNYTELANFANSGFMGSGPYGNLIQGIDSLFYGTTSFGGTQNSGIVFSVDSRGKNFKKLHDFVGLDGTHPRNGLTQASDGTLYGTTFDGGINNYGTIFKIKPDGSSFLVLFNFYYTSGVRPLAPVLIGMDGKLYGTTSESGGSSGNYGTIYSINTDGSNFTKLLDFNTVNGAYPNSALIQSSNGTLYGTTDNGGTHSVGTIFSINPNGTNFTKLHEFDYLPPAAENRPQGSLLMGKDGNLYGATLAGGSTPGGSGVVFSISTTGIYKKLYEFSSQYSNGYSPIGSLIQLEDGNLYGVALGGANSSGIIFSIHTDGSGFKKIFDYPSAIVIEQNSLIAVKGSLIVTEITDKNQSLEFSVYPNPSKNSINLNLESFESGVPVEVAIYNMLGQQVDYLPSEGGRTTTIDISKYPNGNFIVTLTHAEKIYHSKFLKY